MPRLMSAPPDPLAAVGWPVRTERLLIRRATPADADDNWQIRRIPTVAEWLPEWDDDRARYAQKFGEADRLARTLVIERDDILIGDLMLHLQDGWAQVEVAERARSVQAEVGWVLHPDQSGQGLATEAARALLQICFADLRLRRVTAQCFAGNLPSWRVMERIGMRRELHTIRDSLHRSGVWMDNLAYAILAEEWASPPV